MSLLVLFYLFSAGAQSRNAAAAPAGEAPGRPLALLCLGDSLTAGYGLERGQGFTDRLQEALRARGRDVRVINGGVSGDTSAGGLARLDWLLDDPAGTPDAAIVELGANDALRGLDPARTRANLGAILDKLQGRGVRVLLAGMLAPPNLGPDYGRAFNALYPDLARKHGVAFYPFFLEGVAGKPELNQADGIHPNPRGVEVLVSAILPAVDKLLAGVAKQAP